MNSFIDSQSINFQVRVKHWISYFQREANLNSKTTCRAGRWFLGHFCLPPFGFTLPMTFSGRVSSLGCPSVALGTKASETVWSGTVLTVTPATLPRKKHALAETYFKTTRINLGAGSAGIGKWPEEVELKGRHQIVSPWGTGEPLPRALGRWWVI